MNGRLQSDLLRCNYNTRPGATTGQWLVCLLPTAVIYSSFKANKTNYILMTFSACLLATGLSKLFRIYQGNGNSSVKKLDVCDMIPGLVLLTLLRMQGTSLELCILGSLLVSYGYVSGVSTILECCPKFFTYGEATVTVQALLTFIFSVSINVTNVIQMDAQSPVEVASIIMQVGLLGIMIICLGLWFCPTMRSTVGFYCLCFGVLSSIVILPLHIILRESPVLWIIELLFANRTTMLMVCYWIACCITAIAAIALQVQAGKHASTVTRKSFHILVVAVYVPGLIGTYCLLYLATGIVLALFVVLEAMRLLNIPPLSDSLQKGFEMYADEKDAGGGALTPIYLLTGVSLPLWLHPTAEVASNNYLPSALLAGLLAVGIGDTAASAFGSWIGCHHWPNSEKTVEGTVACILSQIVVVFGLMKLGYLQGSILCVIKMIVAVISTSLLEAKTDQVDNLVLPLFMYIILL